MGSGVTDMWGLGHGFWMEKVRMVESRICRGNGGFGLGGEPFVGLGWVLGRGVGLGFEVSGLCRRVAAVFGIGMERCLRFGCRCGRLAHSRFGARAVGALHLGAMADSPKVIDS